MKPIEDPRISSLFGPEDEESLPQEPKSTPLGLKSEPEEPTEASPTVADDSLPVFDFEYLGTENRCYFCPSEDVVGIFYSPRKLEARARGPHGDMKAYHVCNKCMGRCSRYPTMAHIERVRYIHQLELRGSVRGRVKPEVAATVTTVGRIQISIPAGSSLEDTIKKAIVIRSSDGGYYEEIEDVSVVGKSIVLRLK